MNKQEISQKLMSLSCDLLNDFLTKEQASDILHKMAKEIQDEDDNEPVTYDHNWGWTKSE